MSLVGFIYWYFVWCYCELSMSVISSTGWFLLIYRKTIDFWSLVFHLATLQKPLITSRSVFVCLIICLLSCRILGTWHNGILSSTGKGEFDSIFFPICVSLIFCYYLIAYKNSSGNEEGEWEALSHPDLSVVPSRFSRLGWCGLWPCHVETLVCWSTSWDSIPLGLPRWQC